MCKYPHYVGGILPEFAGDDAGAECRCTGRSKRQEKSNICLMAMSPRRRSIRQMSSGFSGALFK
jgi:hypothetical protein